MAPTATAPRTILSVEQELRNEAAHYLDKLDANDIAGRYAYLFGMATVKLAEAHAEIARLKSAPGRITIACATGDCYETVSYDASDLYGQGIFDCLIDDGWGRTSDGTGRCPRCVALDGPRYDRDELASKE